MKRFILVMVGAVLIAAGSVEAGHFLNPKPPKPPKNIPKGLPCGQETTLEGTSANDLLVGTSTIDRIEGLAGADMIFGLEGLDCLLGGTGDDDLFGGPGFDVCDGGEGTDTCFDCELEINCEFIKGSSASKD